MPSAGAGGGGSADLWGSAQLRKPARAAYRGTGSWADDEPPPGSVDHGGGGFVDCQTREPAALPATYGTDRRGGSQPALGQRHHVDPSLGRRNRAVQLCVGLLRSVDSFVAVGIADAGGGYRVDGGGGHRQEIPGIGI